jgi:hypothetical protein
MTLRCCLTTLDPGAWNGCGGWADKKGGRPEKTWAGSGKRASGLLRGAENCLMPARRRRSTTELDGQNGRLLLLLMPGGVSLLGPLLEQVVPNTAPHRKGKPAWGGAAGSSSDTTGPEARRRWPLAACA